MKKEQRYIDLMERVSESIGRSLLNKLVDLILTAKNDGVREA